MPDLIAEKIVKARKEHKCMTCFQAAVEPGKEYTRATYVNDGRIYDWVMCAACKSIESYVFNWAYYVDEGIGADTYDEWAYDTGWAADSTPETQTDEQKAAISYLARRRGMTLDHPWIGVSGHSDDPECSNRADGTDSTYCGRIEQDHLWSTR